jgi:hypothetical protein
VSIVTEKFYWPKKRLEIITATSYTVQTEILGRASKKMKGKRKRVPLVVEKSRF